VQLQQVMMNLMMNSIDAMKDVDGARELAIKSHRTETSNSWYVSATSGVGCPRSRRTNLPRLLFHEA